MEGLELKNTSSLTRWLSAKGNLQLKPRSFAHRRPLYCIGIRLIGQTFWRKADQFFSKQIVIKTLKIQQRSWKC